MATQNRLLLCSATTRVQTLLRRMGSVMAHFLCAGETGKE